jgi:hypothetical protein
LDVSKATGSDQQPAILLKHCAHILAKPLAHIFRLSLVHGYFPSVWKIADVVALHKKKSKSNPCNYRPISLLPIVSKVFESVVASRLKRFIHPHLNPKQFGFRPGHTSLDMLTDLSQRWCDALHAGGEVRAVALDISKAFDKVWHEGLLYKLSRFGISDQLLSWFTSFLSNRCQRVVVGAAASDYLPVHAGVPQGSVLAPLLFLIFINDLFSHITNNLSVFADDSTLWSTIPSTNHRARVATSLNLDLTTIQAWAKRWLVTYNAGKTELLTVSHKKDVQAFRSNGTDKDNHVKSGPNSNPHPTLSFCNTPIPESRTVKIVGLTLSTTLSWGPHISRIAKRAKQSIILLYRARPYASPSALLTIYKSHIRSRMEYLSPIWMGGPINKLAILDGIQKKAERIIGKEHCTSLQVLDHRRKVSGLCFMHRLIHNTAPAGVRSLTPPRAAPPARQTRRASNAPTLLQEPEMSKVDYWRLSCVPYVTRIFNTLPASTQSLSSLQPFKKSANVNDLLEVDRLIHRSTPGYSSSS